MRSRFAFFLGLLALGPAEFRGCGSNGEVAEPLPTETFEGCLVDADCSPRMCSDVRCLAGTCEVVDDLIDRDGDGEGPLALGCGADCDDADPNVRPGVPERCNAIDEDCDGRVDESAMSEQVAFTTTITGQPTALAGWEDGTANRFVVFQATSGTLYLHETALDGTVGSPQEVFRLDRGGAFAQLEAIRSGTDVLLLTRTDIGAVRWAILRPSATAPFEVVAGPEFIALEGQALDMAVAARPGGWYVALDLQSFVDETERIRVVLDDPRNAPVFSDLLRVMPGEVAPLDVASVTGGFAQPFDGAIQLHQGGAVAVVGAPGPLARRALAALPDGTLAVGYTDVAGFLSIQRMDPSGPLGDPVPGPSAVDPEQVELHAVDVGIAVAAFAESGAAIWLRGADLERIPGRESPLIASGATGRPRVGWADDTLGVFSASITGGVIGFGIPCGP